MHQEQYQYYNNTLSIKHQTPTSQTSPGTNTNNLTTLHNPQRHTPHIHTPITDAIFNHNINQPITSNKKQLINITQHNTTTSNQTLYNLQMLINTNHINHILIHSDITSHPYPILNNTTTIIHTIIHTSYKHIETTPIILI